MWRPVTNPTARALASWRYALSGWQVQTWEGPPCGSVSGEQGRALSLHRLPIPQVCSLRPLPFFLGRGRLWGFVTDPTARTLSSWGGAL